MRNPIKMITSLWRFRGKKRFVPVIVKIMVFCLSTNQVWADNVTKSLENATNWTISLGKYGFVLGLVIAGISVWFAKRGGVIFGLFVIGGALLIGLAKSLGNIVWAWMP